MSNNRPLVVLLVIAAFAFIGLVCVAIATMFVFFQQIANMPDDLDDDIPILEPEPELPDQLTAKKPYFTQKNWPKDQPMVQFGNDLLLHGGTIDQMRFSRDQKQIFSRSYNSLKGWNLATGQVENQVEWDFDHEGFRETFIGEDGRDNVQVVRTYKDQKIEVVVENFKGFEKYPRTSWMVPLVNPEPLVDLAISRDGRLLAIVQSQSATVWDVRAGKIKRSISQKDAAQQKAVFSPDGKKLIIGCVAHRLLIWDSTQEGPPKGLIGPGGPVGAIAISADGKFMVTAGTNAPREVDPDDDDLQPNTFNPTAVLWNLDRFETIAEIPLNSPKNPTASPMELQLLFLDHRTLLTVAGDHKERTVNRFDLLKRQPLPELPINALPRGPLVLSPDGKTIAASTSTGRILRFDAKTFAAIQPVDAHDEFINELAFSKDGRTLTTTSTHEIRRWDAASGKPIDIFELPDGGFGYQFLNRDATLLVSRDFRWPRIVTWKLEPTAVSKAQVMRSTDGYGRHVLSRDGQLLAVQKFTQAEGTSLEMWDITSGTILHETVLPQDPKEKFNLNSLVFSDDGETIYTGNTRLVARHSRTGQSIRTIPLPLRVLKLDGEVIKGDLDFGHSIDLAVDPSHQMLALTNGDDSIVVMTSGTGNVVWKQPAAGPHRPGFSPDGKLLAVLESSVKQLVLRNAKTGEKIREIPLNGYVYSAFAFSPDSKRIAIGFDNGTAQIWDIAK